MPLSVCARWGWALRWHGLACSDLFTTSVGVRVLVDAREKLHIPWGDEDNQRHGYSLMAFDTRSAKMASGNLETSVFLQYLPAIKALWADSGIQNAYDRRREFQLVGESTCSLCGSRLQPSDPIRVLLVFEKQGKQKVKLHFCRIHPPFPFSCTLRSLLEWSDVWLFQFPV